MALNVGYLGISDFGLEMLIDALNNSGEIEKVRVLNVTCCDLLWRLPDNVMDITGLRHLKMGLSGVSQLPEGLDAWRELEVIDMTGCQSIVNLPEKIGYLPKLRKLGVWGCSLGEMREAVTRDVHEITHKISTMVELVVDQDQGWISEAWDGHGTKPRILKEESTGLVFATDQCQRLRVINDLGFRRGLIG